MKNISRIRLRQIEKALAISTVKLQLVLKLKTAELILRIAERHKKIGLFIILGWQGRWKSYADTPDISQDIFRQRKVNISKLSDGERSAPRRNLRSTVNFDGAILIDTRGHILHSGTMIEGLRPRATARKIGGRGKGDLSSQFGFREKVHMRHIAAITSSYIFKGTTVFTISEETDDFHIFEAGRIVYSTVRGERANRDRRVI